MKIFKSILAIGILSFSLCAQAAPKAIVEAVQMPAWLDRENETQPVTPGMKLKVGDQLRTGNDARLLLRLPEGSTVKLGENASFAMEDTHTGKIFRATMNVLRGAFRFTTDVASRPRKRNVTFHVSAVTIGIRGTDVWGKSTAELDKVCLIEGHVAVGSAGNPTVSLNEPLQFYQKPRNAEPLPVGSIDQKKLDKWAQETELETEGAMARDGGEWRVIAGSFSNRDEADAFNGQLRDSGFPSEVEHSDDRYNVQIGNLVGEAEASALVRKLKTIDGVTSPSVLH